MTVSPAVAVGATVISAAEVRALEHLGVVDFSTTVNLGAVIIGVLVLVVAGAFTVRSNVAKVWRDQAEGLAVRLKEVEAERDEQRELKHEAINDANAARLLYEQQLTDLRARPDMTALAEQQRTLAAEATAQILSALADHSKVMAQVVETLAEVKTALQTMNGRSQ